MTGCFAKKRAMEFLDDRGRPLNVAPQSLIVEQIWERTPVRFVLLSLLPTLGIGIWLVSFFFQTPPWPSLSQVLWWIPFVFVGPLVGYWTKRRKRATQSPLAAQLAAHRLCGACAYDLHQIEPEADGCVVCPECGAAWHRDRFVFADKDPRESAGLRALLSGGHGVASDVYHDDRGVALHEPLRWPPFWLHRQAGADGISAALMGVMDRQDRWFMARALPLAVLTWGGVSALLYWRSDEKGFGQAVFICIVTSLIAAIVLYAARRMYIDRTMSRRAVDELWVCNNCGRALATDAPQSFDGCVVCDACKRAWRRGGPREPVIST